MSGSVRSSAATASSTSSSDQYECDDESDSGSDSRSEKQVDWNDVDDSFRFAIASLCACELAGLYSGVGRNRKWSDGFLTALVKTLRLPKQVESSIRHMVSDDIHVDKDVYVEMIGQGDRYREQMEVLLHDVLLACLQKGSYDARSRTLLGRLAKSLSLEKGVLCSAEDSALSRLKAIHEGESEETKAARAAAKKKQRRKKAVFIGVSAVIGATVIGVTGGLAAPLVAAGAGVLIGGGGAAVLGSTVGVALITTIFTTAGAGLAGYKMKKRLGDVKEFVFCSVGEKKPSLRSVVAVTGWLTGKDLEKDVRDYTKQWLCLDEGNEIYGLRWESKELHELGSALSSFITSTAVSYVATETLKQTVMASLLSAIAWPVTLLNLASVIDNPWQICINRAVDTGRLLADALLSSKDARRPVTLVGYSMGARVIFYALEELAKSKDSAGIVENVYLLGAPITANPEIFKSLLNDVIAGDCVVAYSRSDWVLKFLHRTATVSSAVAGVSPVELDHPRFINIDLSDLVSGHHDYVTKLPEVLTAVGLSVQEVDDVSCSNNTVGMATSDAGTSAGTDDSTGDGQTVPDGGAASQATSRPDSEPTAGDSAAAHTSDDGLAPAGIARVAAVGCGVSPTSNSVVCGEDSSELRHPRCPVPAVKLSSGREIPQLGFGTYSSVLSPPEVATAVRQALLCGFRHFDCAPIYDTQSALGTVFGDLSSVHPDLKRSDLFITSKLWNTLHAPAHVRRACLDCIQSLRCDYLDCFLVHSPTAMQFTGYGLEDRGCRVPTDSETGKVLRDLETRHVDTWREMEKLVDEGLVRSIGVSNFGVRHLEPLLALCRIPPAVNQVEIHPHCVQTSLVEWCQQHHIHITAFSPLGSQKDTVNVLDDAVVMEIASAAGMSPAQVCLRWSTQRGISVIPHSPEQRFITENLGIFGFSLSDAHMSRIVGQDKGKRTGDYDWLEWD